MLPYIAYMDPMGNYGKSPFFMGFNVIFNGIYRIYPLIN